MGSREGKANISAGHFTSLAVMTPSMPMVKAEMKVALEMSMVQECSM